jgi:hypothetical protein
MKMPDARDRAESESLDMLVDFGRVCLRRRRMHAAGGSKSELAGVGFDGGDLVAEADVSVAMVDLSSPFLSLFSPCSIGTYDILYGNLPYLSMYVHHFYRLLKTLTNLHYRLLDIVH